MEERARQFRAQVRQLGPRGPGRKYPASLRRDAVAYLRARQADGVGVDWAAVELGIRKATLHGWAAAKAVAGFVPVKVVETPVARIAVHCPAGLRVEGLDVAGLADLLRRLG